MCTSNLSQQSNEPKRCSLLPSASKPCGAHALSPTVCFTWKIHLPSRTVVPQPIVVLMSCSRLVPEITILRRDEKRQVRLLGEEEDDGVSRPPLASSRKGSKGGGGKKGKGKGKGGKGAKKTPAASAGVPGTAGEEAVEGGARVDSSHLCFEYHRCGVGSRAKEGSPYHGTLAVVPSAGCVASMRPEYCRRFRNGICCCFFVLVNMPPVGEPNRNTWGRR